MGKLLLILAYTIRKSLKYLFFLTLILITLITLTTTILVLSSGDSEFVYTHNQPVINDVTGLNPVSVAKEIAPTNTEQVINAIKSSSGPISIGGGRYSQGGQTSYADSLHIDMRQLNTVVHFDKNAKEITVQPGITWRSIQDYIDPHNLSVKIMQSYANFTVGGSISVNAHGRYIGEGPLVHSVKSLKLVLADGSLVEASQSVNSDLFFSAIGGYGGIGVIVEATLFLADNVKMERSSQKMAIYEYAHYFSTNIRNDSNIVFHNADIYPPNYDTIRAVSWQKTDKPLTVEERMIPRGSEYFWTPVVAGWVADYDTGKWLKEHMIDPIIYASNKVVWRNYEASYDVKELEPKSRKNKTYVLREYFVPVEKFDVFTKRMADIFQKHNANIINVSIRHAHKDPNTLLSWARNEMFAFVVYYQQGTDRSAMSAVRDWSTAMIDAVISVGGSYYLPYQVFATPEQFTAAYPNSQTFFTLKKRLDPDYRFRNRLWQQHYQGETVTGAQQARVKNYFSAEEQTYLTIPEWYLVFNPIEYATYLEGDKSPSDFPFFESINEYWALYDRVLKVTEDRYPQNAEYLTMLKVIGISTTVELMVKGIYETTIGRFSYWSAGKQKTKEDTIIAQAHRDYSNFIFDKAWYDFDFSVWIDRIWSETPFWGNHFFRKLERKLAFTLEFGFKTLYAKVIGYGAATAYEQSDGRVYLSALVPDDFDQHIPKSVALLSQQGKAVILSVPRWGGFSVTIPQLANAGVQFLDISGNKNISLSCTMPAKDVFSSTYANTLFESVFVSDPSQKRLYLNIKVTDLSHLLETLPTKNCLLDHIYDY